MWQRAEKAFSPINDQAVWADRLFQQNRPLSAGHGYEACWSSPMQMAGQVSAITRVSGLLAALLLRLPFWLTQPRIPR